MPSDANVKFTQQKLPIVIMAIGIVLAFTSFLIISTGSKSDVTKFLNSESQLVANLIQTDLNSKVPALQRLVDRWQIRGGTPRHEFEVDAGNYVNDNPAFQAIEWVDPSFHVRWVIPLEGNEKAVGLNLGFEENRRQALLKARDNRSVALSKPVELVQGGTGLLFYFPIYVKDRFDGFVLVVFKTENWISRILNDHINSQNIQDIAFEVVLDNENIFRSEVKNPVNSFIARSNDIAVFERKLSVTVVPNQTFVSNFGGFLQYLVPVLIIVFSIFTSLLVYYLQKSKSLNRQITLMNEDLEAEVTERQHAEKIAVEANNAKTKFLAAMSHEIRTPLNAVLGVLQILEKKQLPEEVKDKLKVAKDSAFFLLSLVNQVLDFSRIEVGSMESKEEEFTVSKLLSDLYAIFRPQAETKGVEFDYKIVGEGDNLLRGEFTHIRQVLFNLIGNSIKFTDTGSIKVLASLTKGKGEDLELMFEVTDTGYGISETELSSIFDEFSQSDSGKLVGGGTGLGLSISKRLAELMGGSLTVESVLGQGSTFTLKLYVEEAEQEVVVDQQIEAAKPVEPMMILVVEDNSVNQMIIKEFLEKDRHKVLITSNGKEAVDIIKGFPNKFDLIFMDIQMPVMDGVTATREIRKVQEDTKGLPIVALTANAFKSQVDEYIEAGMQDTLTKPIVHSDLRRMLEKFRPQNAKKAGPEHTYRANNTDKVSQSVESLCHNQEPHLDMKTLEPLIQLMPNEQMRLLLDSMKATIARTLPELSKQDISDERVRMLAHEIKGMAANVGLARLSFQAAYVEKAASVNVDSYKNRKILDRIAQESIAEMESLLVSDNSEEIDLNSDLTVDPNSRI